MELFLAGELDILWLFNSGPCGEGGARGLKHTLFRKIGV